MPAHFSPPLQQLIGRILVLEGRASIDEIRAHAWFGVGYVPVLPPADAPDPPGAAPGGAFTEVEVSRGGDDGDEALSPRPAPLTAFDLIGAAAGLDLSAMFASAAKAPTRFPSTSPASDILEALAAAARQLGFAVPSDVARNFKVRMEGQSRRGPLVALAQVFEMCPGLHLVEVRKVRGDSVEFAAFYRRLEAHPLVEKVHMPVTAEGGT